MADTTYICRRCGKPVMFGEILQDGSDYYHIECLATQMAEDIFSVSLQPEKSKAVASIFAMELTDVVMTRKHGIHAA